jgi:hypothetical protein
LGSKIDAGLRGSVMVSGITDRAHFATKESSLSATYLLLVRVFSTEIWFKVLTKCGWQQLTPNAKDKFPD